MSLFSKPRLAVLAGDSLMTGRLSGDHDWQIERIIAGRAAFPFVLISAGKGSQTSAWGVTQIPYWSGLRPDVFVLSLAMNDAVSPPAGGLGLSLAEHEANYLAIIAGMRANNPDVRIIIATMSPVSAAVAAGRPALLDYYQKDRDIAAAQNCELADLFADWVALAGTVNPPQTSEWFLNADGLHMAPEKVKLVTVPGLVAAIESGF